LQLPLKIHWAATSMRHHRNICAVGQLALFLR